MKCGSSILGVLGARLLLSKENGDHEQEELLMADMCS